MILLPHQTLDLTVIGASGRKRRGGVNSNVLAQSGLLTVQGTSADL